VILAKQHPFPSYYRQFYYCNGLKDPGREVHIYHIHPDRLAEIDTSTITMEKNRPVEAMFHPQLPLLMVMFERTKGPCQAKEKIVLYRINEEGENITFTYLRILKPNGNDPNYLNNHIFPLSLDGQYIGNLYSYFMGYDFWRLDSSLLPLTEGAEPQWTLPSAGLQTYAGNYSDTHWLVTHHARTNPPRLVLISHSYEPGHPILFLRRLKIQRRKDTPLTESHWRIFDYWCYEGSNGVENDGPFLAALPKRAEAAGCVDHKFLVLPMEKERDWHKVITIPKHADSTHPPMVYEFRKTEMLAGWLESGVTPHPLLLEPVNKKLGE
jgi:hypothetical protein